MPNDYAVAHEARKGPKITLGKGMQRVEPQPEGKYPRKLEPSDLLKNERHFDPNVISPEELHENRGTFQDQPKPVLKT